MSDDDEDLDIEKLVEFRLRNNTEQQENEGRQDVVDTRQATNDTPTLIISPGTTTRNTSKRITFFGPKKTSKSGKQQRQTQMMITNENNSALAGSSSHHAPQQDRFLPPQQRSIQIGAVPSSSRLTTTDSFEDQPEEPPPVAEVPHLAEAVLVQEDAEIGHQHQQADHPLVHAEEVTREKDRKFFYLGGCLFVAIVAAAVIIGIFVSRNTNGDGSASSTASSASLSTEIPVATTLSPTIFTETFTTTAPTSLVGTDNGTSPTADPTVEPTASPTKAPVTLPPSRRPTSRPSQEPTQMPSVAPSLVPGTLLATQCSGDTLNSYGGDFCGPSYECTTCPGDYHDRETPKACFDEGLPPSLLQSYCRQLNTTNSRPCGSEPSCQAENFCVDCSAYAHTGATPLEGFMCVDEDLSVGSGSSTYVNCVYGSATRGSLLPMILELTYEADDDPSNIAWEVRCEDPTLQEWTVIRSAPIGSYSVSSIRDGETTTTAEELLEVPFDHDCVWTLRNDVGAQISTRSSDLVRMQHTFVGTYGSWVDTGNVWEQRLSFRLTPMSAYGY